MANATPSTPTTPHEFLQTVRATVFTREQMLTGAKEVQEFEALMAACAGSGEKPACQFVTNFDQSGTDALIPPAGYLFSATPLKRRERRTDGEAGNVDVVFGVQFAHLPTVETILAYGPQGKAYIDDAVVRALRGVVARVLKKQAAAQDFSPEDMPLTVSDFVGGSESGSQLTEDTNALLGEMVRFLKDWTNGRTKLSVAQLRQICQSAAFAKAQCPTVKQTTWANLMRGTIISAKSGKLTDRKTGAVLVYNTSRIETWLETRDAVAAPPPVDYSVLDGLTTEAVLA